MFHRQIQFVPREFGKWCAVALFLLTPGSFLILMLVGLVRLRGRGPVLGSLSASRSDALLGPRVVSS
jgi:hypothetical protein